MSISLVLLPLAVAAVTAAHDAMERRSADGRPVCSVSTRMRDGALLARALEDTGASVDASADSLLIRWTGMAARFDRDMAGVWNAHFSGDVDEQRAREVVGLIDAAYGRRVQAAVLQRLRQRAPAVGLRLESESVEDDASVTLVLTVQRSA
ncbi:hypothetical protein JOD57_004147 [Geodermatophilus bullaregiensis]|uniref:hypothetical protein n=1 Tax=Geodermatophilus bullaregiensis TaxID=1564160 RepID=UPI00195E76D1|nr:hypothetical protein [Geodermatophilus bullaregiensis]MBM7808310.1 hypothetical protein [Geodermatophilus bullaregiensis]